jgi:hypothetical protein
LINFDMSRWISHLSTSKYLVWHGEEGLPSSTCPFILFDMARRVIPSRHVLSSSWTWWEGLSFLAVFFWLSLTC